jgi:hypothetical protein
MRTASSSSSSSSSARRLAANRRNARRSTGPRTAAGKSRSPRNATSHGLYCRDLVLPGESRKEFEVYREAWLLRLNPQDVLELLIVDRIVAASWKLRRLQAAEPYLHAEEAEEMRHSEDRQRQQIEKELIQHERRLGGDGLATARMLSADLPTHERYPAAATLAMSLIKGDGGFERLTRIEQRLERSVHRNLEELRRLRNTEDESERLEPPVMPCPFLAEAVEEPVTEEVADQEVAAPPTSSKPIVQNEPNAVEENAAGASQIQVEYDPTSRNTGTPLAECQCHEEVPRAGRPCHVTLAEGQGEDTIAPAEVAATANPSSKRGHDYARR